MKAKEMLARSTYKKHRTLKAMTNALKDNTGRNQIRTVMSFLILSHTFTASSRGPIAPDSCLMSSFEGNR